MKSVQKMKKGNESEGYRLVIDYRKIDECKECFNYEGFCGTPCNDCEIWSSFCEEWEPFLYVNGFFMVYRRRKT